MITGTQKEIGRLLPFVTGRLKEALLKVEALDLAALPVGKTPLDGDNIFASVNKYATEPAADRRPEKHFQYIDIQLVASGHETIGYADEENAAEITEDRREAGDVVFFGKLSKENHVRLETGDFAIFFPWEVHRPNCQCDGEGAVEVKKVVVKVKKD
jgi:biofilm protein TabA